MRNGIETALFAIVAGLIVTLCVVGTFAEPAEVPLEERTVCAAAFVTPAPEEDPDESEKIFDAIKAKCQVVEGCTIVGYAPELIEGWLPEYKNEHGLYLTASGKWVAPGFCVATDPDVIPTGATVIIGDRVYVAADRGVNGKVVDVMVTPEEALTYGCRTEDVYWCMEVEG